MLFRIVLISRVQSQIELAIVMLNCSIHHKLMSLILDPNQWSYHLPHIYSSSKMRLSSKYLQALDSPRILSQNVSVLEHYHTNHTHIIISLDQQTSSHACQSDTVQVKVIHLRLHHLNHGWVVALISTETLVLLWSLLVILAAVNHNMTNPPWKKS